MPKSSDAVVDTPPSGASDWIVPRRVMCAFFWVGIILLFTGIILLVTSKHKEEFYQSWGAILLGLGFCLLLICFILCMHAYCVITVAEDEVTQTPAQRQNQQQRPQDAVRKKAPLKPPPNFKIPFNRQPHNLLDRKMNFNPTRLKTINENGSPRLSRSDSYSNTYGSTSSRADYVRTCVSNITSLQQTAKPVIASATEDEIVHYVASPPKVKISVGKRGPHQTPDVTNNTDETERNKDKVSNHSSNSMGNLSQFEGAYAKSDSPNAKNPSTFVNESFTGDQAHCDSDTVEPHNSTSLCQSRSIPSHIIVQNTPVFENYHFDLSLLQQHNPKQNSTASNYEEMTYEGYSDKDVSEARANPCTDHALNTGTDSSMDIDSLKCHKKYSISTPIVAPMHHLNRYGGATYIDTRSPEEDYISTNTPTGTATKTVNETHIYSRPIATARVTQLSEARPESKRYLPNGAPPQLSSGYSRQYPITAVHAHPVRNKNPHVYTPLRVDVGDADNYAVTEQSLPYIRQLRPLPAIDEYRQDVEEFPQQIGQGSQYSPPEQSSQYHQKPPTGLQHQSNRSYPQLLLPQHQPISLQQRRRMRMEMHGNTDRPFPRDNGRNPEDNSETSNLLQMHGSGLMDRGLNNSANIYLNPDQEFSESKMSIYDNLNYIRI